VSFPTWQSCRPSSTISSRRIELEVATAPNTIALRPPTLGDLGDLVAFFAEMQEAHGAGAATEGNLRDQLTTKRAKVEDNYRLAVADGKIVGWASIWHPEPGSERVFLEVKLHPRDPVVSERLLDWGEERARSLTAGKTGRLQAGALSEDEMLLQQLRDRGYELVRHFFTMEADLADEPAEPVWPAGITVRTFRSGDERRVYEADAEAFRDHWDSFDIPFEEFQEYFFESSEFDPELWFLAEDGEELAGFSLCWNERKPGVGHVNVLAVRRPWRRKGLATALLLHSFRELRRRGRAKVDLGVDSENLTGAVHLYERAGMRVALRFDSFHKELA
jgi:mycothiol synthase